MPRIRRATANLVRPSGTEGTFGQASLQNDDGDPRRIIGAVIKLYAGRQPTQFNNPVHAVQSSQAVRDTTMQQGLHLANAAVDSGGKEQSRAGPYNYLTISSGAVVGAEDSSIEDSKSSVSNFGSDDAWINWPDGGEQHLAVRARDDEPGFIATGIWYYQEGEAGLSL